MSAGLYGNVEPRDEDSKVTILKRGGVTLIEGTISVSMLEFLTREAPKGAVMDLHAARLLGVGFVIGMSDDIKKLISPIESGHMPIANPAPPSHLSDAARRWLDFGQHGLSSIALFAAIFDYPKALDGGRHATRHPIDPSDFVRCVLMLEQTGGRLYLQKASGLSPAWAALIARWDNLERMVRSEVPDWFTGGMSGSATKTYYEMKDILKSVEAHA